MARLPVQRFVDVGDDLVPGFDIFIEGKDASKGSELFDLVRPLIQSITYEEDEEMSAMLELVILNQPRAEIGRPIDWRAVVDSKAFQEGNTIDLYMGYGNIRQFVGRVEITKWVPTFPQSGPSTITIKGFDGRHRMQQGNQFRVKQAGKSKRRKTAYRNLPDELIVKKIAEKYGYGAEFDKTEHKKHTTTTTTSSGATKKQSVFPSRVQPADLSDWDFLRRLAKINRFDLWVDYSQTQKRFVVNFKRRATAGSAEYLFSYNQRDGSLLEAEPEFAIQEQPTDVEVLFYDRRTRKIERTLISDTNKAENVSLRSAGVGRFQAQKEIAVGARVRFSAFGQVIEAFRDKPFRSKSEAETFVKQWLHERERDFLILKGKVLGIETLKPRQIHQFEGMSKRLDGFYRFTQTKHVMAPGTSYQVEFVGNKVLSQEITRKEATTRVRSTQTVQQAG